MYPEPDVMAEPITPATEAGRHDSHGSLSYTVKKSKQQSTWKQYFRVIQSSVWGEDSGRPWREGAVVRDPSGSNVLGIFVTLWWYFVKSH